MTSHALPYLQLTISVPHSVPSIGNTHIMSFIYRYTTKNVLALHKLLNNILLSTQILTANQAFINRANTINYRYENPMLLPGYYWAAPRKARAPEPRRMDIEMVGLRDSGTIV